MNGRIDNLENNQLLDALYQMKLDIESMQQKREEQLYQAIQFPYSLEVGLQRLTKDDLSRIRQTLELKGLSKLKKQGLIVELARVIPTKVHKMLTNFDQERCQLRSWKLSVKIIINNFKKSSLEIRNGRNSYTA